MWTNSKVKKMIKWQCSLWCEIFCTSPLFRAGTGAQTTKQKNWFRSSRNWFGNPAWNTRAMGRSLLTLRGYLEEGGEGNCYRTNRGPPFSQGLPQGLLSAKDILRGASLPTGVTSYEASTLSPKIYLTETSQGLPKWAPFLSGTTSGHLPARGLPP